MPPMPPEKMVTQSETAAPPETVEELHQDTGTLDSDTEDKVSLERMRSFARNFAANTTRGDDLLESRTDDFIRNTPILSEDEIPQVVRIGEFEYDFTEICNYQGHPMTWEPPFQSNVFMMPPVLYIVHGSDSFISPIEPQIVELPMNRMRRKFLRLLISSRAEFLQFDTPEEIVQLTDNDLLRE